MDLKKKEKYVWIGAVGFVSIAFYLFWYINDGVIMTMDGPSYISMQSDREPGYCSFLWLLRTMFGEAIYLDVAAIIQCILAGIACTALIMNLKERFSLGWFVTVCMLLIEFGITLLNRFVAQRRYSYYNSISTEALAYSFWILFFISLLNILYDQNKKSIIMAVVWSIVLISIRKHMLITLPLLFLAILYVGWKKKEAKSILIAFLAVIISFAGVRLLDCSYNYANRGIFAPHTGDSTFILGNEIYVATADMAEHISDDDNRELFLEMVRRTNDMNYHISYAPEGLFALEDHYTDSYDRIKFDINMVVIREYQTSVGMDEAQRELDFQDRVNTLTRELLPYCLKDMIKVVWANIVNGLITTVLKVHRVLNIFAVIIYLGYLALLAVLCSLRNKNQARISAVPFALFTLLAILINVLFVSAALFSQMRYMLYNTAFFYQAGFLMLIELVAIIKEKEN